MRKTKCDLTQEFVRNLLDYNPKTGILRWRERVEGPPEWNTRYAGKEAGTINAGGNRQINIQGRLYYAHRLIWLHVTEQWPEEEIDHRDMDAANNRWENLREATHAQNAQNRRKYASNTSGYKGVHFDKARKRWLVFIQVEGKQTFLGRFRTKKEAAGVYENAARTMHGEFARTSS